MKLQPIMFNCVLLAVACLFFPASRGAAAEETGCRVVQQWTRVELWSPFFVYQLDTQSGLRAETWENRLTGRKITLGSGSELEVDIGENLVLLP